MMRRNFTEHRWRLWSIAQTTRGRNESGTECGIWTESVKDRKSIYTLECIVAKTELEEDNAETFSKPHKYRHDIDTSWCMHQTRKQ